MTRDPLRFGAHDPRVRRWNAHDERRGGEYVLYFCQAYRRAMDNAALAYAIDRANALGAPVLFYESIRVDYPHASDRFHAFAIECAKDDAEACAARGVRHVFFLPRTRDEQRGVVRALANRAALVVSDESPGFVFDRHHASIAAKAPCAYVTIDDACAVPMALFPKQEHAARTLRPKMTKAIAEWLRAIDEPAPKRDPIAAIDLPFEPIDLARADVDALVASCAIDHDVPRVLDSPGGTKEAERRLDRFVRSKLGSYAVDRNDPSRDATTHLSPYLHWGAISARRVALAVMDAGREDESSAAILEQLLVRRGLAFNFAARSPDATSYDAMPDWARATLAKHASDERTIVDAKELEAARSPDELWNAAQLELRARGIIHNYARMLWGKLVLPWIEEPRDAHALLVRLNDKYALDGRDPDGWANIGWCFGLHDRPWPERKSYGTVRTMTSKSARSKLDFEGYVQNARAWRRELGLAAPDIREPRQRDLYDE